MVIRALDLVRQCYTQADGQKVYEKIMPLLKDGKQVDLSFEGVETVPSSFINTALIRLLDVVPFENIKANLKFIDTTKQINEMIKTRFNFEVHKRHAVG
jgi:hypothetical protein